MLPRSFPSACILLLLTAARTAGAGSAAAGDDTDADDDPAGLIVFHEHPDGRLHLHIHLFGGLSLYFSAAWPVQPAVQAGPEPPPGREAVWTAAPGGGAEQPAAALGLLAGLSLPLSGRRWSGGPLGGGTSPLPPPDPPPRRGGVLVGR